MRPQAAIRESVVYELSDSLQSLSISGWHQSANRQYCASLRGGSGTTGPVASGNPPPESAATASSGESGPS